MNLTRAAAILLALYLVPVTLTMHNFWAVTGAAQQEQMFNFLKNLALIGGLLELTAVGASAWSVDAALSHSWGSMRFPGAQRPA